MTKRDRTFEDLAPAPATYVVPRAREGAREPPRLSEALREAGVKELGGRPVNLAALEIGELIRVARQRVGLTQTQLAARIGCKQGDLSDIERGKGRDGPSYKTLKGIAEALGVPLAVNPKPARDWLGMTLIGEDLAEVTCRAADYDMVYPLYADSEWRHMGLQVKTWAAKQAASLDLEPLATGACQIVNVGPAQTARFRCDQDLMVIGLVRGKADMKVRKPLVRFQGGTEPGAAIAIVGGKSEVVVGTGGDESCVFVAVPASVLLARALEEDAPLR